MISYKMLDKLDSKDDKSLLIIVSLLTIIYTRSSYKRTFQTKNHGKSDTERIKHVEKD